MKLIFLIRFIFLLSLSVFSSAQEIYSGSQLNSFRADSFDAENNQTFFVIDNIAGKHIYVFNFLAKPDTKLSSIARKVLPSKGLPQYAQCTFTKTLQAEEKEEWKIFKCQLVENKFSKYPTWYE